MLEREVLIGELLSVDGLATSALDRVLICEFAQVRLSPIVSSNAYVVVGEVTALEHEIGDDTVETGSSVSVSLLASGKGAEVRGRLGDYIVVQLEADTAKGSCSRATSAFGHGVQIELRQSIWGTRTYRRRQKRRSKPGSWLQILEMTDFGDERGKKKVRDRVKAVMRG